MRFIGITNSIQSMNFLRTCAGAELTELREKEVRVVFEATREGEVEVPAHTYEQVVESTKLTLLKLVSKDRAIIDLLRMEQGRRGFMDFLAEMCHSLTSAAPCPRDGLDQLALNRPGSAESPSEVWNSAVV